MSNEPRRIVLTGGPGSGKTVISARIAQLHPDRFAIVPEAATQVYDALQTRWDKLDLEGRRDVQRKIYQLQVDQEDRTAAAARAQAIRCRDLAADVRTDRSVRR